MNFTQQQLRDLQDQRREPAQQAPQQEEIPEFEDPKDTIRWMQAENAKQRKVEMDVLRAEFKETNLKTDREQAAGRVIGSYPDMNNIESALHQQFTQDCYQQGINPQTAAPFQLEAIAAMAAAKCGILPQNIGRQQPNNPLPQGSQPRTWNGERTPQESASIPKTVTLTEQQKMNCVSFGQTEDELKAHILKKNYRLSDGKPAYNVK
jgi:hypothetical protein